MIVINWFWTFVGWGTDENTVIVILGHRTVYQRQQIRRVYEEIYQEDLVKRLESEIKGDFEVQSVRVEMIMLLFSMCFWNSCVLMNLKLWNCGLIVLKQKAVYRWILEPADRDAVLANVAIKSGKNYNVIVEIATILSPEELLAVRRAYLNRYKHSLEEDVAAHTSGHLRQASSCVHLTHVWSTLFWRKKKEEKE